jgi:hypothetical protein
MSKRTATAKSAPDPRGELHRRVGAILDQGRDADWNRASLRVFNRCRQWASFDQCTFKVSLRTLAKACRMSVTTARRGLEALEKDGTLRPRGEKAGCRVFEIVVPRTTRQVDPRDDRGDGRPWE